MIQKPKYVLTDIEGTTTSVSFVYEVLFPYFRNNIDKLIDLKLNPDVFEAFEQTIELAKELEGREIKETREILETLLKWSLEDKKITPLKTLQGILWKDAYVSGEIKGHVYPDVPQALGDWKEQNIRMAVFSSGSVSAQKLIFGYSDFGDLTPFFSHYFDTKTGGKRETETYKTIAVKLGIKASDILFLSDIVEELEAAKNAGFQTMQLVREGTTANWENTCNSFSELKF